MREGLRFDPPPVVFTPEVRWALLRAFGPPERDCAPPPDAESALEKARRLSLSARIAARVPRVRLVAELGEAVAGAFVADFRGAAASTVWLGQFAREVASVAQPLGVPVILLKHAALDCSGVLELGGRSVSDLDALVPERRARELRGALLQRGYREVDFHPEEHQLPPMSHPSGAVVEIHTAIPGLCLGRGRAWADADALLRRGLTAPAQGMPTGCFVPSREVLLAHLLVHALDQHGLAPFSYPLLRAVGDLLDLRFASGELAAFLAGPFEWIRLAVSEAEVRAFAELGDRLAAGDETLAADGAAADDAGRLLAHIVAGTFDGSYQQALKFQAMSHRRHHGSPAGRLRELGHTLLLTRQQIDIIYGRPRTGLGYLGWRLVRPFDLVRRLARYTVSAIRLRRSR